MKIFQVGVDNTTLAFLRGSGFAIADGDVETTEDLYEWVVDAGYDGIVIELDRVEWGLYAARYLRSKNVLTAVIGITRGNGEDPWAEQRATFLENGGDDLLRAPTNPRELAASLRAATRRGKGYSVDVREIRRGAALVRINFSTQSVSVNGAYLHLTPKEMLVLSLLAANQGRTQSKQSIMSGVYTSLEDEPEMKIIDVFVCKLRKKLEEAHPDAGNVIETVWGRGYQIAADTVQAAA